MHSRTCRLAVCSLMILASACSGYAEPENGQETEQEALWVPAPPALTSAPPEFTRSLTATFSFSSSRATSYTCSLDGSATAPCTSPKTYDTPAEGKHTFSVTAVGLRGRTSTPTHHAWTVDTVPPSVPQGLTMTSAGPTSIVLDWADSSDATSGVAGYNLYLNGALFDASDSSDITVTNLNCATSYTLVIEAFDGAGNLSARVSTVRSTAACGTTPPPSSCTASSQNLLANGGAECGVQGWTCLGDCTLQTVSSPIASGAAAFSATQRGSAWMGPAQNVSLTNGATMATQVQVRTAGQAARAKVTLAISTSDEDKWIFLTAPTSVNGTGWTHLSGSAVVSWSGTLNSATWYVETEDSLDTLFVDGAVLTTGSTGTPVCGNGTVESGEKCDLGTNNGAAGSCCTTGCAFVAAGTTCRVGSCANGTQSAAAACTGTSSSCPASTSTSCGAYACVGAVCATSCTGNTQCSSTAACSNSQCVGTSTGKPPALSQVGPRVSLSSHPGGYLAPGNYSGLRFNSDIGMADSGTYTFTDCEFAGALGPGAVFGGTSVTRVVFLEHSRLLAGLAFENAGQKNWTIRWSHVIGGHQGLRPRGLGDSISEVTYPTPMLVEDSIVENTNKGSPETHCEAMQSLGGNGLRFFRVRFVTPGPYVNGVTGQTASIMHNAANSLFEDCEFLQPDAFYYTIYASAPNNTFRRCRIAKGLANYFYPSSGGTRPTLDGNTDYVTGAPITTSW
jgi:hypothetical protein